MPLRNSGKNVATLAGLAALFCAPALAQVVDPLDGPTVNLVDGPVSVVLKFDLPLDTAPAQDPSQGAPAMSARSRAADVEGNDDTGDEGDSLAFYEAEYRALAEKGLSFRIVGTNPAKGAHTTTIPTVLVPLKFVFSNPGNPTLDGTNVIAAIEHSPIFQTTNYKAGPVDLGVTQFGDAVQRAEFWNLPGFSTDYHVLLKTPIVAPTLTVNVPAGKGNAYPLAGGDFIGVLDTAYFFQILAGLLPLYTANELPIFTTDNVFLGTDGVIKNCCILGFHESQGAPIEKAKTWIYAAYTEPGTFAGNSSLDVQALSHETAEWLNDPFVGTTLLAGVNLIPPAVLPGTNGACIINFETGDPLETPLAVFTKTIDSVKYHLQDEVVLPWYLHTTPSFSVNGWYTFQNTTAVIPLVVNAPESIEGSYVNTARLTFAPVNTSVTGNVVYVGRGCPAGANPADPYLADPSGKIALIDRGACAVSLKIDRAVQAGAIGVLIGLVAPGDAITFISGGGTHFAPSLVITQAISNLLKGALLSSPVNATINPNNAIPAKYSSLCGPG